jgi:uncharacterized protein (DUF2252 family)
MGDIAYKDRAAALERWRRKKMGRSVEAYVRGATVDFYAWLERSHEDHEDEVPDGPPVWICGDCHMGNLGPLADGEGKVRVDIRDFDQTVIGNPAHDLIRMGLSFASAARSSNLSGHATAGIIEALAEGYAEGVGSAHEERDPSRAPKVIRKAKGKAIKRRWRELAEERIDGNSLSIPRGKRFWPITDTERRRIEQVVLSRSVREALFGEGTAADDVSVRDAAYWRKGCSSLGLLRYAVLMDVRGAPALVDVKEAVTSAAPRAALAAEGERMPEDQGERIVAGARHLAPALGERMASARMGERTVFVRTLAPQDLKLDLTRLKGKHALRSAHYLGGIVAHAHARQMDADGRGLWLEQIHRDRTENVDAPSWLWSPVVSLLGDHEQAYLDFCRRHPH